MKPEIRTLNGKKLIGKRMTMSFSDNKTFELWRSFMPRRMEISDMLSNDLFSLQVYGPDFDFSVFNPGTSFEKWAAVEVLDFDSIPSGMEAFTLEGGLYAVFIHRGPASAAPETFGYIFGTWLPSSGYVLDDRPHFEVMGDKYKKDDPDSEEEIWIPVKSI